MCGRRTGIGHDYFACVHVRIMIAQEGASGAGGTRDTLAIVHAVHVSGCGRAAGMKASGRGGGRACVGGGACVGADRCQLYGWTRHGRN